jgi:hypothetical protein
MITQLASVGDCGDVQWIVGVALAGVLFFMLGKLMVGFADSHTAGIGKFYRALAFDTRRDVDCCLPIEQVITLRIVPVRRLSMGLLSRVSKESKAGLI